MLVIANLNLFADVWSEKSFDPGVFPSGPRNLKMAAEICGQGLHLLHDVGPIRVERRQPRLETVDARRMGTVVVRKRNEIADLQLQAQKQCLDFLFRTTDVSQT